MRHLLAGVLVALSLAALGAQDRAPAQLPAETAAQKEARLAWWTDARFGMFIHWGLYALPARHEWVKKNERITDADYQKYFEQFNPDLYDPKEWARRAKQAGMKYAVITSKHHEGFCLFDSKFTDYKATNTPGEARSPQGLGRGVPRRRAESRVLLLAARLAPSVLHHRSQSPAEPRQRRRVRYAQRGARHGRLPPVHEGSGPRAADQLRQDRRHLARLLVHGQRARQGPRRLGLGRSAQDGPRAPARDHRQRPAGPARRAGRLGLPLARAVQAARVGDDERRSACRGRRARRSPGRGATTATRPAGRARRSSSSC